MADTKPVQLHPLEHVANVQWGGLAVIFGEQASDAPEQKSEKRTNGLKRND